MTSDLNLLAILGTRTVMRVLQPSELYRVLIPFSELTKNGFASRVRRAEEITPLDLDQADIILLLERHARSGPEAAIFAQVAHQEGKILVTDLDDDPWNMVRIRKPEQDPFPLHLYENILPIFDLVTVSTDELADRVRPFNPRVVVCPTVIEPNRWPEPDEADDLAMFRMLPGLTVGMQGGPSHRDDWAIVREVFPVLAARYPDVCFVIAGDYDGYLSGLGMDDRVMYLPLVPIEEHPQSVTQIDIALAPLRDTPFNRCKSPLKWMESSILGRPVVASPTVYAGAIRDGETGLIARTVADWVNHIGALIKSEQVRRRIGEAARADVLARFSIETNAHLWADAYRSAWEQPRPPATERVPATLADFLYLASPVAATPLAISPRGTRHFTGLAGSGAP